MNRKFIYVSLFVAMSTFTLTSCGGSDEPEEDFSEDMEMLDEEDVAEEETEEPEKLDFSSLSTAEDAMSEYKTMLENYADVVKNGSVDEAKELKAQLDELKSYSEDKFGGASLKALASLSKFALQIESGKDVDLDDAFAAYDKSMEALKNMPGMDAETEKAMGEAQEAMKGMKSLGF
jgi:hypothetical protein